MESKEIVYLSLLRDRLRESQSSASPFPSAIAASLLNRLLITETAAPVLRGQALQRYADLLEPFDASKLPDGVSELRELAGQAGPRVNTQEWDLAENLLERIHFSLRVEPQMTALLAQMFSADAQLRREIEAAYTHLNAPLAGGKKEIPDDLLSAAEREALVAFLVSKFPGSDDIKVKEVTRASGGFSRDTFFLRLQGGKGVPAELVMRRDGPYAFSGNSVAFEHPIIAALFEAGAAVPRPFAVEPTGQVLQRPFILLSRAKGTNIGDVLDIAQRDEAFGLDLARQMAQVHSVPVAAFSRGVRGWDQSPRQRVGNEIEADRENWRRSGIISSAATTAFAWLLAHLADADGPRSLVHRDIGAHNMLVQDSRVSAFLDWETCVIGNPAEDIGYAAYTIEQLIDMDRFLDIYAEVYGQRPDAKALRFYKLWGALRLVTLIAGARAGILAGHVKDFGIAYLAEHYVPRLLCRISEQLEKLFASETNTAAGRDG